MQRIIANIELLPRSLSKSLRDHIFDLVHRRIYTNYSQSFRLGMDRLACTFCKDSPETMRHLFCECKAVRSAMNKIMQEPTAGQTHMGLLVATINDMLFQVSVTKRNAIRLA